MKMTKMRPLVALFMAIAPFSIKALTLEEIKKQTQQAITSAKETATSAYQSVKPSTKSSTSSTETPHGEGEQEPIVDSGRQQTSPQKTTQEKLESAKKQVGETKEAVESAAQKVKDASKQLQEDFGSWFKW